MPEYRSWLLGFVMICALKMNWQTYGHSLRIIKSKHIAILSRKPHGKKINMKLCPISCPNTEMKRFHSYLFKWPKSRSLTTLNSDDKMGQQEL